MATRPLSDELAQQSLDLYELHADYCKVGRILGIDESSVRKRIYRAEQRGFRPTVKKEAPRIHTTKRLGRMHLVIPDCQVKSGVPTRPTV